MGSVGRLAVWQLACVRAFVLGLNCLALVACVGSATDALSERDAGQGDGGTGASAWCGRDTPAPTDGWETVSEGDVKHLEHRSVFSRGCVDYLVSLRSRAYFVRDTPYMESTITVCNQCRDTVRHHSLSHHLFEPTNDESPYVVSNFGVGLRDDSGRTVLPCPTSEPANDYCPDPESGPLGPAPIRRFELGPGEAVAFRTFAYLDVPFLDWRWEAVCDLLRGWEAPAVWDPMPYSADTFQLYVVAPEFEMLSYADLPEPSHPLWHRCIEEGYPHAETCLPAEMPLSGNYLELEGPQIGLPEKMRVLLSARQARSERECPL